MASRAPVGDLGLLEESIDVRLAIAAIAAAVDAQAGEQTLVGPGADRVGVYAEDVGSATYGQERARIRCGRRWPPM